MERMVAGEGELIGDPMGARFVEDLVEERMRKGFRRGDQEVERAKKLGKVEAIQV